MKCISEILQHAIVLYRIRQFYLEQILLLTNILFSSSWC